MEQSLSSTMLQSMEVDTAMQDNDHAYQTNGTLSNGFVDPREMHQPVNGTDLPELMEDTTLESQPQATPGSVAITDSRKLYLPTGCCYDDRMKLHANADYSENPHHPEDPRRISAIMTSFKEAGLIYSGSELELAAILKENPTKYMWRIPAREARQDEICTAHTASHYEWVMSLAAKNPTELRAMTATFDDGRKSLYVGSLTHYAALIAAGGAIETCKNVVEGKVKNAIAVIRPPGHHAETNEAMGFCIFNNVPIAAKTCMQDYPDLCRKILILDWDVHHGNGVQNIFYSDPNVLYISIHVYQDGNFYPGPPDEGVPDGGPQNCGAGVGIGRNINIGWYDQGMGDGEYMAAFQKIVMPIASEFDPDLVIVSAGFDAAAGDELGGCFVSPACYAHMTHMLMSLADGKVAVCLEGGYNLKAISRSALAVTKTLMGEPPQRMVIPPINIKALRDIEMVKEIQSAYWTCMRPSPVKVKELEKRGAERLSIVARGYETHILSKKFNMVALPIMRNTVNKVFLNQVLATPKIMSAKKVLLFVHDPPEILAQVDPVNNTVLAHNAWMATALLPYINWAISKGFGIIDVNFPRDIALGSRIAFLPRLTEADIQQQSRDLLTYLWDNLLQEIQAAPIVLFGVGDAYLGIKQLLTSRDIKSRIPCVVSFVTGSLRPVKSETDTNLSNWYKAHSAIYVSADHSCWNDEENAKRVRKNRFGAVRKAQCIGLDSMLQWYKKESSDWILEKVAQWEAARAEPEETDDEMGDLTVGMSGGGLPVVSSGQSLDVPVGGARVAV